MSELTRDELRAHLEVAAYYEKGRELGSNARELDALEEVMPDLDVPASANHDALTQAVGLGIVDRLVEEIRLLAGDLVAAMDNLRAWTAEPELEPWQEQLLALLDKRDKPRDEPDDGGTD